MTSKFRKPRAEKPADAAAVAKIINKAAADDGAGAATPPTDKTFSMTITGEMADAIEAARKPHKLTRVAWLRQAAAEKLEREARRAGREDHAA